MKKEILVFISECFADWEASYVSAEFNKPETEFVIKTLAINKHAVKSMGGFTVVPDYSVKEMPESFVMLILVGGDSWLKGMNEEIKPVVDLCVKNKIPVAAICDACTFLADKGYLDNIKHTGNSLSYLKRFSTGYRGEKCFIEKQVVVGDLFITANGTSAIELAKEILKYFDVMKEDKLNKWYRMFKIGFYK